MVYSDPSAPVAKMDHGRDFFVQGIVGHRDIWVEATPESLRAVKFNGKRKVRALVVMAVTQCYRHRGWSMH